MSRSNNLGKIVAAVSIVSLLVSVSFFSFYKAFNNYLDNFVADIIGFFKDYGIYLSVGEFWLLLGVILVFIVFLIALSGD